MEEPLLSSVETDSTVITGDDELDAIVQEENEQERFLKIDRNGPYKLLLPLCAMHHFLREQHLILHKRPFQKEERAITTAIDDICIQYGGHMESLTGLEAWGLLSVFPLMNVTALSHPTHGRFKTYLDSLADIMTVISLCENICESVEMDDPDTGFTTPNLRSIGHQLALLYHALKRMAPYFCEELQGHFSAVKAVWESNFLAVEEKEWLLQFCSRVLESVFMMMQPTLSPPRTTRPTVTIHPDPPSSAGIAPPSAANSANPSPLSSSHHPHYPKPPPPLLPDEAGNQTGVSALLLPWEGQEVDPRGSVTFAKELAGHPVNIVGTQRRENAPLRVAEACHFNNPFDYLLNGVKFSYNAVQTGKRQ
ncbi:hypothetical protein BLNAU_4383 [Blattamonas nauphoetae]|uniref:Uncharacterized protein n=1 Tax=Blattamonas nauphoetae TaxID=2049346 RepID=A0ABQ9YAL5_9EUKA|nr:hypothetical protein BLNAU_4383 [Blattamonas nauphoetae]